MAPSAEQGGVKLPSLKQSASAGAIAQKTSPTGAELGRPASQADLRPASKADSPPKVPDNQVTVKFRGDHGITFEGTRVTGSVLQAWMLGVRPGWTVLTIANNPVQTKEDVEEQLAAAVETEKRYEVVFMKGQGKFGTEAKEKAEKEKRQLAKLRKEYRFQASIERVEHRGTTFSQLERVHGYLEENCSGWVDHLPAKISRTSGKPLRMDFLNFHHLNNYMILPATKPRKCAFVEMLANGSQPPSWFVSHWWQGPVTSFMECVKKQITTRALSFDTSHWIWAFACRQHQQVCEITQDPKKASFFKVLETCKYNMLLVLDQARSSSESATFKRVWCGFEAALCLDHPAAPLDIAIFHGGQAELLIHGMTEDEEKIEMQQPGRGIRAKVLREAGFPIEFAEAGLSIQLEKGEGSKEEDKASIVNSLAGLTQQTEEAAVLAEVNSRLQALFAAALWSRASVGEKDLRKPAARQRLSKVASALRGDHTRKSFQLMAQGVDSESFRTLAESLPPGLQELTLSLRCSTLKSEDMDALAKALPKQMKELRLDFTRCESLTDAGIERLAKCLNFEETLVYLKLAETKVTKEVQDFYTEMAFKNEENGANGTLKNVSRALGMSLVVDADQIGNCRQKIIPAVNVLGKVLAADAGAGPRGIAALRAISSFGEKARQSLGDEAAQRAKELEVQIQQAEADRKAKAKATAKAPAAKPPEKPAEG
mmetsp:Transcript_31655/g.57610  ORF Transcript_31655/g.57610 Transcript_31655/m.57610 type:complete len:712 (+) Transcript_31655:49-2184(+)